MILTRVEAQRILDRLERPSTTTVKYEQYVRQLRELINILFDEIGTLNDEIEKLNDQIEEMGNKAFEI